VFRQREASGSDRSVDERSSVTLPSRGRNLRQQLEQFKPNVEKANKQVEEVLKPSPKHDWTRAAEVKIAILGVLTQEIPVAVFGDAALTAARAVKESAEKVNRVASWVGYFLYVLGVALGVYAALHGIKGVGGGE